MKKIQVKTLALNISKLKTLDDSKAVKGGTGAFPTDGTCMLSGL